MSVERTPYIEDHERFRNELASVQPDGKRAWIYARKPSGVLYKWRTVLSWVLLVFFIGSPFITVAGNQFLLFNIVERKFVFFGVPFWPSDFYLVALLFLTVIVSIVLVTASVGRIWCGWACPQTIFMEMVFRKLEWIIEGNPKEQANRNAGPWTTEKVVRKGIKIVVFFTLAFIISNVFLSYVLSSTTVIQYVYDGPAKHALLFGGLIFFAFVFFVVFYRFREQACLIACPYGRYMSALVDSNTLAVTYDYARGEHREKWKKNDPRSRENTGHCIDCYQCVTVCPTGIDIRNGIQLECVNCTACIDACNHVMEKVQLPQGLIRYASLDAIEGKSTSWLTNRIKAYSAVLVILVTTVVTLFALRADVDVLVLRSPKTTWQSTPTEIVNFYTITALNKSQKPRTLSVNIVSDVAVRIVQSPPPATLAAGEQQTFRVMLFVEKNSIKETTQKMQLVIQEAGKVISTEDISFIAPELHNIEMDED